jgi:hypothetical protein
VGNSIVPAATLNRRLAYRRRAINFSAGGSGVGLDPEGGSARHRPTIASAREIATRKANDARLTLRRSVVIGARCGL